ncbi:MAG: hypothetical protein Kow00109_10560 [Acidobacteriota bacterium]
MQLRPGYLVVSDLHVGAGRDPETGLLSRREDFLFDEEFAAFLAHHAEAPEWWDVAWTLVIAGDFLDFLQISEVGPAAVRAPRDAEPPRLRRDPVFGLKAGPRESAAKLRRAVAGHTVLFRALASFARRYRLVIVSGNHDAEFIYPEVREELVRILAELADAPVEELRPRVKFRPWFHLEEGIYIEHGHQYDGWNSFHYVLDPRLPEMNHLSPEDREDLELPLGSLFVRYLFNRIELENPIADNLKPPSRFLLWFVLHEPVRALRFLFTGGRLMLRRLHTKSRPLLAERYRPRAARHRATARRMVRALADEGAVPAIDTELLDRLADLAARPVWGPAGRFSTWTFRLLLHPWTLLPAAAGLSALTAAGCAWVALRLFAPLLPGAAAEFTATLGELLGPWENLLLACFWAVAAATLSAFHRLSRPDTRGRDRLRERAAKISELTGARYVVLGHTHDADRQVLPGGVYFNSGTWTKVFSPAERVSRDDRELTFVRLVRQDGGYAAELLRWEAAAVPARPARILRDPR